MTDGQRKQITAFRQEGMGYKAIAKQMGLPRDTVRSFCRRNGMAGNTVMRKTADEQPGDSFCRECGKELHQIKGVKKKVFCCSQCREKWWHGHPGQIRQKAVYSFICAGCGKEFTAYGNSHRKYCSHECYIRSRFRGGADNE